MKKKPAWQRVEDTNLAAARLLLAGGYGGIAREWAELFLKRHAGWQERFEKRSKPMASEAA